jgi:TIR domain
VSPAVFDFDVFLSHHSGDKAWVICLKAALMERGVKVWLDRDEIRPGDLFIDALQQGIERCHTVALIVSAESIRSSWVREEYHRALALAAGSDERRLIPCVLRDAALPGFLASRHWVDFRDPQLFELKVDELCWGITGQPPRRDSATVRVLPIPAAGGPVSQAVVTEAEIRYIDVALQTKRKQRRAIVCLGLFAPVLGLVASRLAGASETLSYVGPALITGLIGIGVNARRWSRLGIEVERLVPK